MRCLAQVWPTRCDIEAVKEKTAELVSKLQTASFDVQFSPQDGFASSLRSREFTKRDDSPREPSLVSLMLPSQPAPMVVGSGAAEQLVRILKRCGLQPILNYEAAPFVVDVALLMSRIGSGVLEGSMVPVAFLVDGQSAFLRNSGIAVLSPEATLRGILLAL